MTLSQFKLAAALSRRVISGRVVGMAVIFCCTCYAALSLDKGWIPHDEGQLGHTAERILQGDLPHRDFCEPYTGGLGYLNAAAFLALGVCCESLRWTILPFFVGFVACVYWIARRAASPSIAALVTFCCTCLTLPVYPAGMPSWYNLFFATYGAAALLRHIDSGRTRWVILAGICGGCSILIKITGLYFVAAGLLLLSYREPSSGSGNAPRGLGYPLLATVLLLAFGALGFYFFPSDNPIMNLVHFLLPWWSVVGLVLWSQWRVGSETFFASLACSAKQIFPFTLAAISLPLALAVTYARADALSDLWNGLFVLPQARLQHARMPLPDAAWFLMALPVGGLLAAGFGNRIFCDQRWTWTVAVALAALLAVSHTDLGYVSTYQGLRHQLPIIVLAAVATLLWAERAGQLGENRRKELMLLAATTVMVSLVQYPYAGGFYFFYAAPLGVLTALFVVKSQPAAPRGLHLAVLGFVILFLVLRMHHPGPAITGGPYQDTPVERLGLERGDLRVCKDQARRYRRLVRVVQAHSSPGSYIYATPDCLDVYFLCARRNPTPTFYEFFDRSDPPAHLELMQRLDAHCVTTVVLKGGSEFSSGLSPELLSALQQRFAHQESIWTGEGEARREAFRVLWRRPAATAAGADPTASAAPADAKTACYVFKEL